MPHRRARIALLLAACLATLTLSAAVPVATSDHNGRVAAAGASVAPHQGHEAVIDGAVARRAGHNPSARAGAERTFKHLLVVFAPLALLLAGAWCAQRALARRRLARHASGPAWSPRAGRAPPHFRLSIV